ncbi:hypothetical protein FRZ67_08700 [Panacibacter ginsenosidivorans]|uniref:DNA polymerase III subunit psi n=1 Tax=Panacibacter ginsenosidivorans TaxID=1813871 RepID=A0A5B8V784_9BACT|nr:hypothetical protein [Panacibacter ginsenosidivorans]QEC67370.1 hypothetical protein FRZ67_08700 [Panacibacter ginsenosidivorans]
MSTQLPGFIIAGLYKDSLVLVEETTEQIIPAKKQVQNTNKSPNHEVTPPPQPKKWFLGDNKKNITILLKDPDAVHINDEWLGTLSKLLAACKLNLADVAIVNLKENHSFADIKQQLQPQYVLMFDVSANDLSLPFSIPNYQLQQYGGCAFMTAPAVTLSADKTTEAIKTEKRNLWEKLKVIFNV